MAESREWSSLGRSGRPRGRVGGGHLSQPGTVHSAEVVDRRSLDVFVLEDCEGALCSGAFRGLAWVEVELELELFLSSATSVCRRR